MIYALTLFIIGAMTPLAYVPPQPLSDIYSVENVSRSTATPSSKYSFASPKLANDHGKTIDLEKENKLSSQWLNYLNTKKEKNPIKAIIVPGYTTGKKSPPKLHKKSHFRLHLTLKEIMKKPYQLIIVSGGNVHPEGTPFNEALEMKKHLMKDHKVPEHMIAIEPYARNSVTNLRNTGRFLLAHNIKSALIVTSIIQNYYMGYPSISSFNLRSKYLLGYPVGQLKFINQHHTLFTPSQKVFTLAEDSKDP